MYSPDISQHSPRLYRLGKHYGVPMTVLADRLVCFGLQNLEQVMPEKPVPVVGLETVDQTTATNPTLRRSA
ncbi:MAG: hypothetical protein WC661_18310 [Opitutaceae bacterium]|jgi:hypothetical protein